MSNPLTRTQRALIRQSKKKAEFKKNNNTITYLNEYDYTFTKKMQKEEKDNDSWNCGK